MNVAVEQSGEHGPAGEVDCLFGISRARCTHRDDPLAVHDDIRRTRILTGSVEQVATVKERPSHARPYGESRPLSLPSHRRAGPMTRPLETEAQQTVSANQPCARRMDNTRYRRNA